MGPDGRIYFYGRFEDAGGDPTADNLAVYDPVTGSVVGIGSDGAGNGALNDRVRAITWVKGVLYVGGSFSNFGGLAAWNGTAWAGRGGFSGTVYSLAAANGYLYVAGLFTNAGGAATADRLGVWDGYTWTGLGDNGSGDGALNNLVYSVQALSDGRVFVGGAFTNAGANIDADFGAWWDPDLLGGTPGWEKIGTGPGSPLADNVNTVAIVGSRVIVGGDFENAAGIAQADFIAEWTGTAWIAYGSDVAGTNGALGAPAFTISPYGSNVLVGGAFDDAAGVVAADRIASWNGSRWVSLGSPLPSGYVTSVNASGRSAYITGGFADLAGIAEADHIAVFGLPAAPSAPRVLAGVAGTKKVSLSWSAPSASNGASITDYVIQYRKSGSSTWLTFNDGVKTSRSATVTGLSSGSTYQFRVQAKNDWGTGASSGTVTVRAR